MRRLTAVARREVRAFFHSAMAPVVLTGFLVLTGLWFTLFVLGYSEASRAALTSGRGGDFLNVTEGIFRPLFRDMVFFMILFLPAVSMRLLAAEYRSRRYDLIMSWPVSAGGWVVGKWLSVVVVAALMVAASGVYLAAVALLGKPEIGPLLGAAAGVLLVATAVAAWGTAFSALFSHQLAAYLLTFALMVALLLVGFAEGYLPAAAGRLVTELALLGHVQRFSRGVLDSRDLVYLVGLTVFGLVVATQALAARRLAAGRRLHRVGPTVVVGLLLLIVQLLAARYPWSVDLTPDRRYSLAPQTVRVLDSLAADSELPATHGDAAAGNVTALAFYQTGDPARDAIEVLLRAMADHTRRFRYEIVDPEQDIERVRRFDVTTTRTVVITAGDRSLAVLEPGETELISTVYRLVSGTRPVVYFVQGHGEHLLDSGEVAGYAQADEVLRDQGYDVRLLMLADLLAVPGDADLVVLAGPKLAPAPAELAALDRFVARGGALLVLVDPVRPREIAAWCARYSIRPTGDVIVSADRANRQFGVSARTIVVYDTYGAHEITRSLNDVVTLFPLTQNLEPERAEVAGVSGFEILRTGPATWLERDPETRFAGRPAFDPAVDVPGPLTFGVALEVALPQGAEVPGPDLRRPDARTPSTTESPAARESNEARGPAPSIFATERTARLVVIGNSEFASNANLGLYGNRDLWLNIFGWLARDEALIQLRGRELVSQPVVLTAQQKEILGWGCVVGWPLLVGAVSLSGMLWHRRRR